MKVNENNFINQLKSKNSKSMNYLVDIYGNLIYKIVYSILYEKYNISSVEECVNDIFMKIWDNIDCFDSEKGTFKTWIITIAKFKAIDYKRKLMKYSKNANLDTSIAIHSNIKYDKSIVSSEEAHRINFIVLDDKGNELSEGNG